MPFVGVAVKVTLVPSQIVVPAFWGVAVKIIGSPAQIVWLVLLEVIETDAVPVQVCPNPFHELSKKVANVKKTRKSNFLPIVVNI